MKHELLKRVAGAVATLFRGFAAALRRESCCPRLHFAGWR